MPNLKVHCIVSKKRTGYSFKSLHRWIDEPRKELGSDHRSVRHSYNRRDAYTIRKFWDDKKGEGWGKKALVEWSFHIALDHLETAFKISRDCYGPDAHNFSKFAFLDSGFVLAGSEKLSNRVLSKIFPEFPDRPPGMPVYVRQPLPPPPPVPDLITPFFAAVREILGIKEG